MAGMPDIPSVPSVLLYCHAARFGPRSPRPAAKSSFCFKKRHAALNIHYNSSDRSMHGRWLGCLAEV
jgi:hypothetical protein